MIGGHGYGQHGRLGDLLGEKEPVEVPAGVEDSTAIVVVPGILGPIGSGIGVGHRQTRGLIALAIEDLPGGRETGGIGGPRLHGRALPANHLSFAILVDQRVYDLTPSVHQQAFVPVVVEPGRAAIHVRHGRVAVAAILKVRPEAELPGKGGGLLGAPEGLARRQGCARRKEGRRLLITHTPVAKVGRRRGDVHQAESFVDLEVLVGIVVQGLDEHHIQGQGLSASRHTPCAASHQHHQPDRTANGPQQCQAPFHRCLSRVRFENKHIISQGHCQSSGGGAWRTSGPRSRQGCGQARTTMSAKPQRRILANAWGLCYTSATFWQKGNTP